MGHLDTTGLITHRFEARDVIEAWDCIREKRNGCLGVVLDWI
jgi:threonine dehydrogenase-like Zn-dependent dehydrogenase